MPKVRLTGAAAGFVRDATGQRSAEWRSERLEAGQRGEQGGQAHWWA